MDDLSARHEGEGIEMAGESKPQEGKQQPHIAPSDDHDRPQAGIAEVTGAIRWLIEFAATVAEPIVIAVVVIMIASDVSGGAILNDNPWLKQFYAWGQGIGVEGQLVAFAILSRKAWRDGKKTVSVFLSILVFALAFVSFLGVGVANFQQTFHTTVIVALGNLGISDQAWVWIRAIILTTVGVTGAYLLYVPPKALTDAQVEAQVKQKQLRAKLAQADADIGRAKLEQRMATLRGVIGRKKPNDAPPEETEIAAPSDGETATEEKPLGEEKPKIKAHLVSHDAHERGAKWWSKVALKQWLKEQHDIDITDEKANDILRLAGANTRVESQGNPYVASPKDAQKTAKELLHIVAKATRKAPPKLHALPRNQTDEDPPNGDARAAY